MMKKIIVAISLIAVLTGCNTPEKRNKWQNEKDFKKRRTIYYNEFVEGGGMMKDDSGDQINPLKKEIQNALNQGKVINQIG